MSQSIYRITDERFMTSEEVEAARNWESDTSIICHRNFGGRYKPQVHNIDFFNFPEDLWLNREFDGYSFDLTMGELIAEVRANADNQVIPIYVSQKQLHDDLAKWANAKRDNVNFASHVAVADAQVESGYSFYPEPVSAIVKNIKSSFVF